MGRAASAAAIVATAALVPATFATASAASLARARASESHALIASAPARDALDLRLERAPRDDGERGSADLAVLRAEHERDDDDAAEPAPPAAAPRAAAAPSAPLPAFDARAAEASVRESMESLPICRRGEVDGRGVAQVTFAPGGSVVGVALSKDYAGTATGACVARRFSRAQVPAFEGEPRAITVRFEL